MRLKVLALDAVALACLIGAWFYATGRGGVNVVLLPPLDRVLEALREILQAGDLWGNVAVTLGEILAAFILACAAGLAVGFLGSRTPLRARVIEPLIAWGYMAPLVLFYPLFILWLDVGSISKIAFGAISGFFPIAFNSLRGYMAVDPRYLTVGRAFGASARQADWLIKVPASLPMVMSGIRIGAALSIITVILAEMLAAERGLGYLLAEASHTLQSASAFAYIFIIVAIVAVLQVIIQRFGRVQGEDEGA